MGTAEDPTPRDVCPNCFAEVGEDARCTECGFDLTTTKVDPTGLDGRS